MSIIDNLLASLRADAPVRQVLVGAFWTAVVLDTDPLRCGLASTLRGDDHETGPAVTEAGHLCRRSFGTILYLQLFIPPRQVHKSQLVFSTSG